MDLLLTIITIGMLGICVITSGVITVFMSYCYCMGRRNLHLMAEVPDDKPGAKTTFNETFQTLAKLLTHCLILEFLLDIRLTFACFVYAGSIYMGLFFACITRIFFIPNKLKK